jgi:putative transposase
LTHNERVSLIDKKNKEISTVRQSELLDISRTSIYYKQRVNQRDVDTMRLIDEIFTKCPFYGSRRIKHALEDQNIFICREHVQRLMKIMGLEAIYPKRRKNTSGANVEHKKYPYLLNDLVIKQPNHVWGTDITYIRLEEGWAYLSAILDWFSRYVVSFELSSTLETNFCVEALNHALKQSRPDIHNSDQGVQYTSKDYTDILKANSIRISMDGRGRCMDNIFTERLWRTVKYENVYLKSYRNIHEAQRGLTEYFHFYNTERKHQSLDYRTPKDIYFNRT